MTRGRAHQIYAALQEMYACMCVCVYVLGYIIYIPAYTISIYPLIPVNEAQSTMT